MNKQTLSENHQLHKRRQYSLDSKCRERFCETYIHSSVTSTNNINSSLDDMVKENWSKCSGINDIYCILNHMSKVVECENVFGA